MLNSIKWNIDTIIRTIVLIFYFIFFIKIITNENSYFSFFNYLALFSLMIIFFKRKIILNTTLILCTIIPFIFVGLNEVILKSSIIPSLDPAWFPKISHNYKIQFIAILAFLLVPSLILNSKFNKSDFFNLLLPVLAFSILYNSYMNIVNELDRERLYKAFNPIILYDYMNIAISLLTLCYGFYLNKKISYLIILLSLLNIFLIILHGTRGAWIGVPIALLIIFLFYRKSRRKIIFTSLILILPVLTVVLIPNSPLQKRLSQFHYDQMQIIENQNYNTSTGTRLALWNFAIEEFKKQPLTGVGFTKVKEDICEAHREGTIGECTYHTHNIFFQFLAAHGILGLTSLLIIILAPFTFFLKLFKEDKNSEIQLLCCTGIVFITYIVICGLTDFYFYSFPQTMLYYLVIFTLISLIMKERREVIN